jgi:hypothetical protein
MRPSGDDGGDPNIHAGGAGKAGPAAPYHRVSTVEPVPRKETPRDFPH